MSSQNYLRTRKTMLTAGILSVAILAGVLFANSKLVSAKSEGEEVENGISLTRKGLEEYSSLQSKLLASFVETGGEQEKNVRLVFSEYLTTQEVLSIAKKYNLQLQEIHIGWGEHKAGFSIGEEFKTNEEFIRGAEKSHSEFIETVLSKEDDSSLLERFQDLQKSYQERGLTIYGIDAKGSVEMFKRLEASDSRVRSVEMMQEGKGFLLIPISPYDFDHFVK